MATTLIPINCFCPLKEAIYAIEKGGGGSKCEYFILRIIEHRLKYTLVKIILTSNVEFKAKKKISMIANF